MMRRLLNYFNPRRSHFWAFFAWLGPGAVASFYFRSEIPWNVFMSWYAIIMMHLVGWGTGRAEQEAKKGNEQT